MTSEELKAIVADSNVKPMDQANALLKYCSQNTLTTLSQLSVASGLLTTTICELCYLHNLNHNLLRMVHANHLSFVHAFILRKLPKDEQERWLDHPQFDNFEVFVPEIIARIKVVREAKRKAYREMYNA